MPEARPPEPPRWAIKLVIRAQNRSRCCASIHALKVKATHVKSSRQQRAAAAHSLFEAVIAKQPDIVRALIFEHGDELRSRARTASGATALHYAASVGCANCIRLLARPELLAIPMAGTGLTALHVAAGAGHFAAVTLLLKSKSLVSSSAALGETALHVAAQCGATDVMEALLTHGGGAAAAEALTKHGHSSLHLAAHHGHAAAVRLLISSMPPGAAAREQPDGEGDTPLHAAVVGGHSQVVELLLNDRPAAAPPLGALSGETGLTLLHLAIRHHHKAVARLLLEHGGAPVDARALSGETALHLACKFAWPGGVDMLLSCRADPNAQTPVEQFTPMYMATFMMAGHPRLAQEYRRLMPLLLAAGATVDATNAVGNTAAECAEYFGLDGRRRAHPPREAPRSGAAAVGGEHTPAGTMPTSPPVGSEAGGGDREHQAALASSLEELCVSAGEAGDGSGASDEGSRWWPRAVGTFRCNGAVVFPSLLPLQAIEALRGRVVALQKGGGLEDRSPTIRSPMCRELRGVPMDDAREVLELAGRFLAPFLREALRHETQQLLECNALVTRPGAEDQAWHTDVSVHDERFVAVQIALGPVAANQGALEVVPGTHLDVSSDDSGRAGAGGVGGGALSQARSQEEEMAARGIRVAVPAGSVTLYSPRLIHRGSANTHTAERCSLTLTLLAKGGMLPPGIPYTIEAADAFRWRLECGRLVSSVS